MSEIDNTPSTDNPETMAASPVGESDMLTTDPEAPGKDAEADFMDGTGDVEPAINAIGNGRPGGFGAMFAKMLEQRRAEEEARQARMEAHPLYTRITQVMRKALNDTGEIPEEFHQRMAQEGQPGATPITDAEIQKWMPNSKVVQGALGRYVLNGPRLESMLEEIHSLLDDAVHEDFYRPYGAIIAQLAADRSGEVWGNAKTADALFVMGCATGRATPVLPREAWYLFSNEIPAATFTRRAQPDKV